MKVRIGVGLGTLPSATGDDGATSIEASGSDGFGTVIDRMEELPVSTRSGCRRS